MNKLDANQIQTITTRLTPQFVQNQRILAFNNFELEQEIRKQIEENPLLELDKSETDEETDRTDSPITGNYYNYKKIDDEIAEYLINKAYKYTENPFTQLHQIELDDKGMIIGEEIIGNLDNDGYLRASDEELMASLRSKYGITVSENDIEKVRRLIMHFDPPGLASRNLQECLIAQLDELETDDKDRVTAKKILRTYYDDFTHKRYAAIARKTGLSKEYMERIIELIQKLNPVPAYKSAPADYIIPDFIVKECDDGFKAELNHAYTPEIRISKIYVKMLNSKTTDNETKAFLKKRFESANLFLQALKNRRQTLLKVMNAILNRQKEFFMTRGMVLLPMNEKDIASDINMDISTVSRAIRGKYVQADFGIFELKRFFTRSVNTTTGEDISNSLLKRKIRELIDSEDKTKPLSDDKITQLIKQSGLVIARRTVTKYREEMKIPKATLRRKFVL